MVSAGQDWSTDDMRSSANSWSLANDVNLREYLMLFGQKLEESYRQVQDSLGHLDQKIETSCINLGNVTNRLAFLSNSQFVESRVSDDDEATNLIENKNIEKQKTDAVNLEEVFCRKVGEALTAGVNFVEGAFETIEFENSDSEEDEDVLNDLEPIYESRNVYHLRRLPHVVGTSKFMTEENVGLETSSEEKDETSGLSESEDSDQDLDDVILAPNVEDQVSDYSLSDQDTEEENKSRAKLETKKQTKLKPSKDDKRLFNSSSEENDDDSNLHDGTSQQNINKTPSQQSIDKLVPKTLFVGELPSKIGGASKPKVRLFDSSSEDENDAEKTRSDIRPKKLFVNELATKIGAKQSAMTNKDISSSHGEIAFTPSDQQVNAEATKPVETISKGLVPKKTIFDSKSSSDNEEVPLSKPFNVLTHARPDYSLLQAPPSSDVTAQPANPSPVLGPPQQVKPLPRLDAKAKTTSAPFKQSTLFDSDSDSDDLFSSKPVQAQIGNKPVQTSKPVKTKAVEKKTVTPLTDSKTNVATAVIKKNVTAADSPTIGTAPESKKSSLFSSEDEEDGIQKAIISLKVETPVAKQVLTVPVKKMNLFEDSSDDDDMDVLFKKASNNSLSNTAKSEDKSQKVKSSLFSESSDEDPIFGVVNGKEVQTPKPVHSKSVESTTVDSKMEENIQRSKTTLFLESKEDPIFGAVKKVETEPLNTKSKNLKPMKKKTVVSDLLSESVKVETLEPKKIVSKPVNSKPADSKQVDSKSEEKSQKARGNLFSQSSEEDLFFGAAKVTEVPTPKPVNSESLEFKQSESMYEEKSRKIKNNTLFSDLSEDDQIFGAEKKEEFKFASADPVTFHSHIEAQDTTLLSGEEIFGSVSKPEKSKVDDKKMEFLAKAALIDLQKRPPQSGKGESQSNVKPQEDLLPKTENKLGYESAATTVGNKLGHFSDSEQDEADGNAMSGTKKQVRFKDVLSAKLAKGPRPTGKRKTSLSKDEGVSQHNLPAKTLTTNIPGNSTLTSDSSPQIESEKSKETTAAAKPETKLVVIQSSPKSDESSIIESISSPLESLTKSRAKLPTNRRLPTKKGLKAMGESGVDQVDSLQVELPAEPVNLSTTQTNATEITVENIQTVTDQSDARAAKVKENSLQTDAKMEEKITEADKSKEAKTNEKVKEPEISLTNADKAKLEIETEKKSVERQPKTEAEMDKKSVETKPKTETKIEKKSAETKPKTEIEKSAEIVETIAQAQETADKPKLLPTRAEAKSKDAESLANYVEDSDDDLFGPPPMPDVISTSHDPLFGTPSSDEDDLFGEKGTKPRASALTSRSLFDDDDSDDDLFASH